MVVKVEAAAQQLAAAATVGVQDLTDALAQVEAAAAEHFCFLPLAEQTAESLE